MVRLFLKRAARNPATGRISTVHDLQDEQAAQAFFDATPETIRAMVFGKDSEGRVTLDVRAVPVDTVASPVLSKAIEFAGLLSPEERERWLTHDAGLTEAEEQAVRTSLEGALKAASATPDTSGFTAKALAGLDAAFAAVAYKAHVARTEAPAKTEGA